MSNKLQTAIGLAQLGFHIFPLLSNSKKPAIKDFPNKATRDPQILEDWWIDPIMETENDYNIGISTTRFGDNESLVVIDVDNKGEKKGDEVLEELDMLGKETPATFTQLTPTGGRHLIYRHPTPLKQGVNVLGNGLDIRSKGGYIVGSGSELDGKTYQALMDSIKPAPEWLVNILGAAPEKSLVEAPKNVNQETAIERAIYYLENEAPESIKGHGGDQTAYKVAAKVKDYGVDEETCLELMLDHWFDGSGWSPEKLQAKIAHAYKYGNDVVGSAAPEADFVPVAPQSEETLHYLQAMNQEYALIYLEGGHFILHETIDEKGNPKRVYLNEQSFKRRFSPYSLQKRGTYATEWLDWKDRREYRGVCFNPEREARNGYYNLWRGFTSSAIPYSEGTPEQRRGFDLFMAHARANICRGDEKLFSWLMGYFAHMVQRPFERPLTTIVFRGGKGVGKNALIDRIGCLLGQGHYMVAHDARYLTSNFNAHLESCLCLVLDEAFWSGDKSAEGKLKGITTAPEILIERKGKEPYMVENYVRLVIIGNEKWLVPASFDERRYAVLDVGDGMKQRGEFFEEMRILMDDKGGNRVLLDYLKNYDLSKINVNKAPQTQALLEQKVSSLEPFEAWWYSCLVDGRIINADFGEEWPESIDTSLFRQAFARSCRDMNIRSRLPDENSIGKLLRKLLPAVNKSKRREGERTVHTYVMPTLDEARASWSQFVGQEVMWE